MVTTSFCITIYQNILASDGKNNIWTFELNVLIETLVLIYFFYDVLENYFKKIYATIIGLVFLLIWLYLNYRLDFSIVETNSLVLEVIIVMFFATIYFYRQTNIPKSLFVYETCNFWIVVAYFIYLTGTMFLYLYWHRLTEQEQYKYYYLNDLFSVVRTVLLSIAMLIKEKKDEPPVNNYPMQYTL
jgi:hypothetical protein